MAKVILHIGDKVTHQTLGEGVVTIVDDEYVTVKFATKELTFPLPNAFEKGFLKADDAIYIVDEDVEEADSADIPLPTSEPTAPPRKEHKLGLVGWLIAVGVPATYTLPFVVLFLIIYLGTKSAFFLIRTILGILFYLFLVIFSVNKLKEPIDTTKTYAGQSEDTDSSATAKTAGLMLGAGLLGYHMGKHHKSHSERVKDDLLWQEKYHDRDNYYDGDNW